MTFAPRFSPDGNRVVLSRAVNGSSNIYAYDLRTHSATRLTEDSAIDTSPCYSPDGSQIVFNSDRGGSQQIYVMSAGGGGAHRISFGSGKYGTPVWSPRGDLIAFTKISGGSFSIGVMRPDGSGRTAFDPGLPGRGAHLGPEWPGADVFCTRAVGCQRVRRLAAPANDRLDRIQPARCADTGGGIRSGLVAIAALSKAAARSS